MERIWKEGEWETTQSEYGDVFLNGKLVIARLPDQDVEAYRDVISDMLFYLTGNLELSNRTAEYMK